MTAERPLCRCHGEPMSSDGTRNGKRQWRCAVRAREYQRERYWGNPEFRERVLARMREYYWNLSGYEYNRKLLRARRSKALARMRGRMEASESKEAGDADQ